MGRWMGGWKAGWMGVKPDLGTVWCSPKTRIVKRKARQLSELEIPLNFLNCHFINDKNRFNFRYHGS
jgi:hypothetical protein